VARRRGRSDDAARADARRRGVVDAAARSLGDDGLAQAFARSVDAGR
jgi:hypothetical protein